ncbi:Rap1a/Tai family immunity protein [Roseibium sp.]|uniref:Rap1a/Tai family immunity protein n=1 Tax=Roseibium sp. TaxID=1936156 RepID=UPI003BAAB0D9
MKMDMKMFWGALVAMTLTISLVVIEPAAAEKEGGFFYSGNDFREICDGDITDYCLGFVAGAVDTTRALRSEEQKSKGLVGCIPIGVELQQLYSIVIREFEEHPEELHYPASYLLLRSIAEAFPCN